MRTKKVKGAHVLHKNKLIIKHLGLQPYSPVLEAMHRFTDLRTQDTTDEIWLLEHAPVFTQGQAGKAQHLLATGNIPIVQSNRGGQVTYHGPGQQIAYLLIDLKTKKMGVRDLVTHTENAIIDTLQHFNLTAKAKPDAPGVYINESKICSLGFRIRRGCSFHGLALNVNMDLSPFLRINPCGYAGMKMTQTADLNGPTSLTTLSPVLIEKLTLHLGYHEVESQTKSDLK